jgi:hypothetical protein
VLAAVLLVAGAGAAYKVDHHNSSHVDARGARPGTGAPSTSPASTLPALLAPQTTTTGVPDTTTTVPGPTTTTATTVAPGAAPTTTTVPLNAAGVTPAATGTYTYAVSGNEVAAGFALRSLPPRMTIKVHGAPGIDPRTRAVFDLSYSSAHTESEVVQWGSNGVSWTDETVRVVFGSVTQTLQGVYLPPMLQIPAQLVAGRTAAGNTTVSLGGTLERVEDWKVSVLGPQTVSIGGQAVPTVKVQVDRVSRPGAGTATTRTTTFWYSPTTRMWVEFAEHIRIQPSAVAPGYDATFTATQIGFSASTG